MDKIGFMQGRLVDQIDGKIQAFPWEEWRLEFPIAAALNLKIMEWTLDENRLDENPFVTPHGQAEIRSLMHRYGVRIFSLTGDCFMQSPFWKSDVSIRPILLRKLDRVLNAASRLKVRYIVLPLVDNGRLETEEQKKILIFNLLERVNFLIKNRLQIIFETEYTPGEYAEFLNYFPRDIFNVNYDIGNSASLGFDPTEEFMAYGNRIVNVHVKDRLLAGSTVPLGTGAADFNRVFSGLFKLGYSGNYILQTARASDGDHVGVLEKYVHMTNQFIKNNHGS